MATEAKLDRLDLQSQKDTLQGQIEMLNQKIRQTENEISFINGILFALDKVEGGIND